MASQKYSWLIERSKLSRVFRQPLDLLPNRTRTDQFHKLGDLAGSSLATRATSYARHPRRRGGQSTADPCPCAVLDAKDRQAALRRRAPGRRNPSHRHALAPSPTTAVITSTTVRACTCSATGRVDPTALSRASEMPRCDRRRARTHAHIRWRAGRAMTTRMSTAIPSIVQTSSVLRTASHCWLRFSREPSEISGRMAVGGFMVCRSALLTSTGTEIRLASTGTRISANSVRLSQVCARHFAISGTAGAGLPAGKRAIFTSRRMYGVSRRRPQVGHR